MISDLSARHQAVGERITQAALQAGRNPSSVHLLAVSKTFPPSQVQALAALGQRDFGENYVQEGVDKIQALRNGPLGAELVWHCIGPIQSNKTRLVAEHFDWVHTVDRLRIAQRLNEQRPAHLPPLQVCLQVNIDGGSTKSGIAPEQALVLARAMAECDVLVPTITDQIDANVTRTAFSPYIYEYKDYAVGMTDADGRLIAQCAGGMPIFVADAVGSAVRDGLGDQAIECASRNPEATSVCGGDGGVEHPLRAKSRRGRDRDERREVEERRLSSDPILVLRKGMTVLVDEIPLVQDEDESLPRFDHGAGDMEVLGKESALRVDDEQGHVGTVERCDRANRRILLGHGTCGDLSPPLDPCRVHQSDSATAMLEMVVDRIARGAGYVADDRALLAEEAVQEARLADIRATDDRDGHLALSHRRAGAWREAAKALDEDIEEISGTDAMLRAHRVDGVETERGKLMRCPFPVDVVRLVRDQQDRLAALANQPGNLGIARIRARRRIDHEEDEVRVGDRHLRLVLDGDIDHTALRGLHAAGVDDPKAHSIPIRDRDQAVAGCSGSILHHRPTLAHNAVEEGALPDVRSTDQGHERQAFLSRAIRAIRLSVMVIGHRTSRRSSAA